MTIMRGVLAVLVGFMVINIAVMAFFVIAFYDQLGKSEPPDPSAISAAFMAGSIAFGFIAAAVGGFLTALIAGRDEWKYACVIIGVFLALSIMNIYSARSQEPLWAQIGNTLAMIGGIGLGTFLRVRFKATSPENATLSDKSSPQ
ncbi:MAG: hypothetical protein GC154_13865 [bacterium]|nr:hypothetical protein [bacterium]